jgi:transposase InsO family protein
MGPKASRSTVLSPEDEAVVVAFRRHTLLPLDDCLYALQPSLPHLTRSSLHRCLQRHGIARLPETGGTKVKRSRFKAYPIGFFHIDIAEVHTEEGRLCLFVAVDRTSKFAFAQLHERAARRIAADFLRALAAAVPYRIHTVLTDNGAQFVDRTPINEEAEAKADAHWATREEPRIRLVHAFDHACEQNGIERRTTKPAHPWTNGQVERMNRTLEDATVRRYHYGSHDELRRHLQLFLDAYDHARRLKTLRGLTPCEFIRKTWTEQPSRFTSDPTHYTLGPNS